MFEDSARTLERPMDLNVPLAVYVVSRPRFDEREFQRFLEDARTSWRRTPNSTDAQELVEAAGRVCYMSFGPNQSDRNNTEYIRNLVNMGHESVLEHVSWSFVITGISRALSHQIVRHRVGFAFSQLSQQYHDESEANFKMPVEIEGSEQAEKAWERAIGATQEAYLEILRALDRPSAGQGLSSREFRRAVRSAARSVLPSCTATTLFMTANARALRHFFTVRGGIPGDREMRDIAVVLLKIVAEDAPAIFSDFSIATLPDGSDTIECSEDSTA